LRAHACLVTHAASGQVARAKLDAESEKQRVRAPEASHAASAIYIHTLYVCVRVIYVYTHIYIHTHTYAYIFICIYTLITPRLQVNAARDERIKEIETQTQLELEAKTRRLRVCRRDRRLVQLEFHLELWCDCCAGEAEEGDGVRGTAAQAGGGAVRAGVKHTPAVFPF